MATWIEQMLELLKKEAFAYKIFGQLLRAFLFSKNLHSKCSLPQFLKQFVQLCHEALTNPGKTIDDVATEALGSDREALSGKVAMVTGANSGLGLQCARVLQSYGCHVIWAVRNVKKAQVALEELQAQEGDKLTGKATILQVDISDLTTVKPFVTEFLSLGLPLHMLILNAGIMAPVKWEATKQGMESMFATNNLGHFLMSELLMPKLEETAKQSSDVRVVILSSGASQMCDGLDLSKCPVPKEEYHEIGDYCVTKAIDAFHARALQKKYEGTGIRATAVHPGIIETGLLAHNPGISSLFYQSKTFAPFRKNIPQGSATTLYCAVSPDVVKQVDEGWFYYYNCAPQYTTGITKPGVADHLVDEVEARQLELVKPYM